MIPGRPASVRAIKHLVLGEGSATAGRVPRLYFEAKIDFSDVRSRLRGTSSVNRAFEIFLPETADAIWTRDMAQEVDPDRVRPAGPDSGLDLASLPSFVSPEYLARMETPFLTFLMRHFAVTVYRNFFLKIYSDPGDTRGDFEARCLDLLRDSFRLELDALHETFVRRLEQVREKFLGPAVPTAVRDFDSAKLDSMLHDTLHGGSERITELFLNASLSLDATAAKPGAPWVRGIEVDQRLHRLESEALVEIDRLLVRYQERVRTVDEYALHPNFKDIHLVRTSILWIEPAELVK
jgi:hypothetical protein